MIVNNFKHKIKFNKKPKDYKIPEIKKDFYDKFRYILNLILF